MITEKIAITLKTKMVVLTVQPFDGDIDVESLLKIDYCNILGEILTFPVVFNRIANLRSEIANALAEEKMDMDVFEAQIYEEHRKKLVAAGEKGTEKSIDAAITRDARYIAKKKKFFNRQKDFDYLDSLYWSAKSKDTKLDRLSEKISPAEFEKDILEGSINGVMIKMQKKAIR